MPQTKTKPATITLRVGPNFRAEIERYAKRREMSVGEFVRYCVQIYTDFTSEDPDDDGLPDKD